MSITRNDCLVLLSNLEKQGIDTKDLVRKVVSSTDIELDVIKFINENRPFDVSLFYEKLRKSYNDKHSLLYKNIVTYDKLEPKNILVTLSSLALLILLFMQKCEDQLMFLRNARFLEIEAALFNYSKTFDIVPCIKLLNKVKIDLKAFEYLKKLGNNE